MQPGRGENDSRPEHPASRRYLASALLAVAVPSPQNYRSLRVWVSLGFPLLFKVVSGTPQVFLESVLTVWGVCSFFSLNPQTSRQFNLPEKGGENQPNGLFSIFRGQNNEKNSDKPQAGGMLQLRCPWPGLARGKGGHFVAVTSPSVILPRRASTYPSSAFFFFPLCSGVIISRHIYIEKNKAKIRAGPFSPHLLNRKIFIPPVLKWRNSELWKTTQAAKHTSWGDLLKCFSVANEVKQTARERIKGLQQYLHNMTGNNEKRERPAVLVPLECKIGHSSVICR